MILLHTIFIILIIIISVQLQLLVCVRIYRETNKQASKQTGTPYVLEICYTSYIALETTPQHWCQSVVTFDKSFFLSSCAASTMSEDTVPENPMGIFYTGDFEKQLRECLFKKVGSEASSVRSGYVSTQGMFFCNQMSENEINTWPFTVLEITLEGEIAAKDVNKAVKDCRREGYLGFVFCPIHGQDSKKEQTHVFLVVQPIRLEKELGKFLGQPSKDNLSFLFSTEISKIKRGQPDKTQRQCLMVETACYVQCKLRQGNHQLMRMNHWHQGFRNIFRNLTSRQREYRDKYTIVIREKLQAILQASGIGNDTGPPSETHSQGNDGQTDETAMDVQTPSPVLVNNPLAMHISDQAEFYHP